MREPPHSPEAERAYLGAAILDQTVLKDTPLTPESFYLPRHRAILKRAIELTRDGTPLNLVSLTEELRKSQQLQDIGGPAYLVGLAEEAQTVLFAGEYADTISERARQRGTISFAQELQRDAYDLAPPDDLLKAVDGFLARSRPNRRVADRENISLAKRYATGGAVIPTGYATLDKVIGGLPRGDLTLIAARTSVGKSSLALQMADRMAASLDSWGLIITPDQPVPEILAMHAARECRLSLDLFRRGIASEEQVATYLEACDALEGGLLKRVHFRPGDVTVEDVYGEAVGAAREGADFIILDTVNRVRFGREGKVAMLAELGSMLKGVAQDWDVGVVGLAQVRREVELGGGKPTIADLADAPGSLANDANTILLLHRDREVNAKLLEVGVGKAKAAAPGIWLQLGFNPRLAEVSDSALMAAVA